MEKLQFKQGYWSLNPLDLHKRHHSKISEDQKIKSQLLLEHSEGVNQKKLKL